MQVKEALRYTKDVKEEHDFLNTTDEIRNFFGILLLTGYHSNTCECYYWSDAEDLVKKKCRVTKPVPKVDIFFTLCGQLDYKSACPGSNSKKNLYLSYSKIILGNLTLSCKSKHCWNYRQVLWQECSETVRPRQFNVVFGLKST
ncbi:hypothetical protein TNCV_3004461 [Trichonephila clavipes]|nr:hypothetical protein TNCV_3004461 [Trichonephila clavipes]